MIIDVPLQLLCFIGLFNLKTQSESPTSEKWCFYKVSDIMSTKISSFGHFLTVNIWSNVDFVMFWNKSLLLTKAAFIWNIGTT